MRKIISFFGLVLAFATLALCGRVGAQEERRVAGVVVDESGKPVAGALVWLWGVGDFSKPSPSEVTTGADGTFAFEGTISKFHERSLVVAWQRERGMAWRLLTAEKDLSTLGLALKVGAPFRGLVRDKNDKPIAGAKVWVEHVRAAAPSPQGLLMQTLVTVETDEQGRFSIVGFPAHTALTLTVSHPQFATAYLYDVRVPKENLTVTLSPASRIVGRVVYEDGKPVVGIRVGGWLHGATRSTRFLPTNERGSVFTGKVILADTGKGVPNVGIYGDCTAHYGQEGKHALTDADGNYRLVLPPHDRLRVYIATGKDSGLGAELPNGYIPKRREFDKLSLQPGETKQGPTFELIRAVKFVGLVIDPEGKPVEGAEVRGIIRVRGEGKSDKDGKVVIEGLLPEQEMVLLVSHRERNLALLTETFVRKDEPVIALPLERGAIAKGRVLDMQGKPVVGARIQLQSVYRIGNRAIATFGGSREIMTDKDGSYEIRGLLAGVRYSVKAIVPGAGESDARSFEAQAGVVHEIEPLILAR